MSHNIVTNLLLRSAASTLYLVGLSLLIPLFLYLHLPNAPFSLAFLTTGATAAVCILGSAALTRATTLSWKQAVSRLGWFSLVPAMIAIVLNFYNVEMFWASVQLFSPNATVLEPAVRSYVDRTVPRLTSLIVGYSVIGVSLIGIARKMPLNGV